MQNSTRSLCQIFSVVFKAVKKSEMSLPSDLNLKFNLGEIMSKINLNLFAILFILSVSFGFGINKTDITKRIKFAKGKSSATVADAVLPDEVNTYLVKVSKGQRMKVKVTSVEKNASFRIRKPSGGYAPGAGEMDDPTNWSGTITESGDYKIEVAPDRGNATYRLTVWII